MSSISKSNSSRRCSRWWFLCWLLVTSCATPQSTGQETQSQVPTASATPAETVPVPAASVPTATDNQSESATKQETAIWEKLAQADEETYVVLLRHAIAPGTGDPTNFQLDDCATQRNLSEPGRQQAKDIGEIFRQRDIPIVKVLSSQWCRCLETAELMNIGPVEPFPAINSFFQDRSTADTQTDQVQDYIFNNRDQAGVIVMVTHQVNITALTDVFPPSGTAVVLEIDNESEGQLNVIGQILD